VIIINDRLLHLLGERFFLPAGHVKLCPRCSSRGECDGCGADIAESGQYDEEARCVWCNGCGRPYPVWRREIVQPIESRAPAEWTHPPPAPTPPSQDSPEVDPPRGQMRRLPKVVEPPYIIARTRAVEFLRKNPGRRLCDRCLFSLLGVGREGVSRETVRSTMRELEETIGFQVSRGRCAACGETSTVCSFLGHSS
jgi:hypothetical protein